MCGDINRKKTDFIDNDKKDDNVELKEVQIKKDEKEKSDEFNSTFKIVYSKKNSGFTSFLKDKTINEKDGNNDSFFYSFKTDVFEDWYDGLLDVINSYNKNNSRKRNSEHNGLSKTTKHTKTEKINIWKPIFKHKYDKQAGNLRINIWTIVVPFILSILMGGGLFFSLYDENLTTRIISGVLLLISSFTLFFSLWILAWKRYNFKKSLSSALDDIFKISRNIKNDKDKKVVICFDNFNEELLDNNLFKDFINNVIELFNKKKNQDLNLYFFFVMNNDKLFDNNNLANKTKNFLQELINKKSENKENNISVKDYHYSGWEKENYLKKLYLSKIFNLLAEYNNDFFESIIIKNVITAAETPDILFKDYLFTTMNFLYICSSNLSGEKENNNYDLNKLMTNNLNSSIFKFVFQPYSYIFDKAVKWFSPSEIDSLITELKLMFEYIKENNFIEYVNPIQVFLIATIKLFIPKLYEEINYFNDYILFKNNIFSDLKFDLTKDFNHKTNKPFFSRDSKYFKISNLILENKDLLHNIGAFDYLFTEVRINEKQWVLSEFWYTNFIDISNYYYILVNKFKFEHNDFSRLENYRNNLISEINNKEKNIINEPIEKTINESIEKTKNILTNNTFNAVFENASFDLLLYHDLFLENTDKNKCLSVVKKTYHNNNILKYLWTELFTRINYANKVNLLDKEELLSVINQYKKESLEKEIEKEFNDLTEEFNDFIEGNFNNLDNKNLTNSFFRFDKYLSDLKEIISTIVSPNENLNIIDIDNKFPILKEKKDKIQKSVENKHQTKAILFLILYIKKTIFENLKSINSNLKTNPIGCKVPDDKKLQDLNRKRFIASLEELIIQFKNNFIDYSNNKSWFETTIEKEKVFKKEFLENKKLLYIDDVYSLMWNYPNNKIVRTWYDVYYSKMFFSIINNIFYGLWDLNSTISIDKNEVFKTKLFNFKTTKNDYEYFNQKYFYIYFLLLTLHSFEYIFKTFKIISLIQKDNKELIFFDLKIDKELLEDKDKTYEYIKTTLVSELSNLSKQLIENKNIKKLLDEDSKEENKFSLFSSKNRLFYDWLLRNKKYRDMFKKHLGSYSKFKNLEYNLNFNTFISNLVIDSDLSTSLIIDSKLMLNSKDKKEVTNKKDFINDILLETSISVNNKDFELGKLVSSALINEYKDKPISELSVILIRNDKENVHFYTFDDFFLSKTNLFEDDLTFTYTFNHKSGLNYLDYVYPYIFDKSKKEEDV